MKQVLAWLLAAILMLTLLPTGFAETAEPGREETTGTGERFDTTTDTEQNQGVVKPILDGDHAYISSVTLTSEKSGVFTMDENDKPGNDSSADNDILRTFDQASYTIRFQTQLRQEALDQNIQGYKQGRVYFEILLPADESVARLETEQIDAIVKSNDGYAYFAASELKEDLTVSSSDGETVLLKAGTRVQHLRGNFLLSSGDGAAAIGSSSYELATAFRVINMKNGDTIRPFFAVWLQYNDLLEDEDYTHYHSSTGETATSWDEAAYPVVCMLGRSVSTNGGGTVSNSVAGRKLTVSARPNYNVGIAPTDTAKVSRVDQIDFATGNADAPNYDKGTVYGRFIGYGVRIEMLSLEEGKGMIGIEFPDENTVIDFDLMIDTDLWGEGRINDLQKYPTLFYDAAENRRINKTYPLHNGRIHPLHVSSHIPQIPFNKQPPNTEYASNCCYDGGTWTFTDSGYVQSKVKKAEEKVLCIHASVQGIKVNSDLNTHFPSDNASSVVMYDADPEKSYWQAEQAVLSAGQIYVVQPYERELEDGTKWTLSKEFEEFGNELSVSFSVYDGNFKVTEQEATEDGGTESVGTCYGTSWPKTYYNDQAYRETVDENGKEIVERQANEKDDLYANKTLLFNGGNVSCNIYYGAYKNHAYASTLTEGCLASDMDWASEGQGVTPYFYSAHTYGEDRFAGGAYDVLIKFDDTFFSPESSHLLKSNGQDGRTFWAAKKDGTGWTDDDEMKRATQDDLVFYKTLDELYAAGGIPVAALSESRGVAMMTEPNQDKFDVRNQLYFFLDGKIRPNCAGDTYMVTYNYYFWTVEDVMEEAIAWTKQNYSGADYLKSDGTLKNEYVNLYFKNGFPSKENATPPKFLTEDTDRTAYDAPKFFTEGTDRTAYDAMNGDYPVASFRRDAYFCSTGGNNIFEYGTNDEPAQDMNGENGLLACQKATYVDLVHEQGTGAPHYQDTCFVLKYNPTITKNIAQKNPNTTEKVFFNLDNNERIVDYRLQLGFERAYVVNGTEADNSFTYSVYIEDTLPDGMRYVGGSACFGGTYTQDDTFQTPGTVEGGIRISDNGITERDGIRITSTVAGNKLSWFIEGVATVKEGESGWYENLYFSCQLQSDQLSNHDNLTNTVKIYQYEDDTSGSELSYGGRYSDAADCSLEVVKLSVAAIEKVAIPLVADPGQDQGFTMMVTNSSSSADEVIVVDTLPINGLRNSSFHGDLLVKGFTLTGEDQADMVEHLGFYYTTALAYQDCRSITLSKEEVLSSWTQLTWNPETASFDLPADQSEQIVAIAAVGNMPAATTLSMTILLHLPDGQPGDRLVNYLSDSTLETYATSELVNRILSGRVWLDPDRNGSRTEADVLVDGVTVSLLKWNETTGEYESVLYPDTTDPVKVQSGQQVSVNHGEVTAYETGCYRFTNLQSGTYAVQFTDGNGIRLAFYTVSPKGTDNDTHDSDADGVYHEQTLLLESADIKGIEMPPALELKNGLYLSSDNDLGLYKFVELLGAQAHIVVSPELEEGQRPTDEHEAQFTNGIRFGFEVDRLTLQSIMAVGDRFNTGFLLQTVDKLNSSKSNTDYNVELMQIEYAADGSYQAGNQKGNQQVFAANYDILKDEQHDSHRKLDANTMILWTEEMEQATTAEDLALLLEQAGLCVFSTSDVMVQTEGETTVTTGSVCIMTYLMFGGGSAEAVKAKADREIAYRAFITVYDSSAKAFVTEYSLQKANSATRIYKDYIGEEAFNGASVAAPGAERQLQ